MIGLARALVLAPGLPNGWLSGGAASPTARGRWKAGSRSGIRRLFEIAEDREGGIVGNLHADLHGALQSYEARDKARIADWMARAGA